MHEKQKLKKMAISMYLVLDREFVYKTELRGSVYRLPPQAPAHYRPGPPEWRRESRRQVEEGRIVGGGVVLERGGWK